MRADCLPVYSHTQILYVWYNKCTHTCTHAHTHTHTHTHIPPPLLHSLYADEDEEPYYWIIVTINFTDIFPRICNDSDYYDWMPWDGVSRSCMSMIYQYTVILYHHAILILCDDPHMPYFQIATWWRLVCIGQHRHNPKEESRSVLSQSKGVCERI